MILREISSGITHIEDLPIVKFMNVLQNIGEYEITEKVDGSQILFGIDDNGFYTSRESKGGIRIYNEGEYKLSFSNTYMRSAHKLLESFLPELKEAGLRNGDQVEAEVLYGELPNVIPYSKDTNYIIFLRTTEGNVNIDNLNKHLSECTTSVSLVSPYTLDGKEILLKEEYNNWEFSRVPKLFIDSREVSYRLSPIIRDLFGYLKEDSGINKISNFIIQSTPLNKRPNWCAPEDWKTIKEDIKITREHIRNIIRDSFIIEIKNILLEHYVHPHSSQFGPSKRDGGWIEGVVLRDTTGKQLKIVDLNKFGIMRESTWEIRNNLTEKAKSTEVESSFLGSLLVTMASSLGHPSLGTIQAKKYLKDMRVINEDTLNILDNGIDVDSIKAYWLQLFEQKKQKLGDELDKYLTETKHVSSILDKATKKKTLETFAGIFEKIEVFSQHTSVVSKGSEFFKILIGEKLGNV